MEYIRDITVTFTVDTNKRTITLTRELDGVGDLIHQAEDLVREMRKELD